MQLLWLHYKSSKNPRYLLCLELGRKDGKIYSIETNQIDVGSRNRIISARKTLDNLSLDRKIAWIKQNCPSAMAGFRTLSESKATITETYPVNGQRIK